MRSFVLKTFFAFTLLIFLALPTGVFADTLFISPLVGSYSVGQTFSVRILASSPRQAINAVSGVLSFPADKLQVISVSKIGSVLSLWVQEPTFSNSLGTVTFEGVVPNPGFSESDGRVLAVNFRVVGTGSATVRLSSGTLLANDGYGTNVLKILGSASYNFEASQQITPTPPAILETNVSDTAGTVTDLGEIVEQERKPTTLQFSAPSFRSVIDWLLKFFSVVIPIFALIFLLTHTAVKGVGNITALRRNVRKDLHNIDRLVEKSFDILKEDISDSIHVLERARSRRTLTAEEDAIIHRLRQNLIDAEKIIHKEVINAEREIGD